MKKTYVLTVSETFPKHHISSGEKTLFVSKILNQEKNTTIRSNYDMWSKRIIEVNKGNAVLSLRYWSGIPYRSAQQEFHTLHYADYHEVVLYYAKGFLSVKIDGFYLNEFQVEHFVKNEGLTYQEFVNWFFNPQDLKPQKYSGILILFASKRYCSQ